MKKDKVTIGKRIEQIRNEKGMSQEEFGSLIDNAHKSLVSKWEKGQSLPNNNRLKLIATLGRMNVNQLLYGDFNTFLYTLVHEYKTSGKHTFFRNTLNQLEDDGQLNKVYTYLIDRVESLGFSYQDENKIISELESILSDHFDDFANFSLDMAPEEILLFAEKYLKGFTEAEKLADTEKEKQTYKRYIKLCQDIINRVSEIENS